MALITSTSDPTLYAALVSARSDFEQAGWVIYQNLHYKVKETSSGEVAFELHDSEETAKSTSF
jgi:hypothetical protein